MLLIELQKKLQALRLEAKNLQTEMETKYAENPGAYTPGDYNERMGRIQRDAEPLVTQIEMLRKNRDWDNLDNLRESTPPSVKPGQPSMDPRRIDTKSWGTRFIESKEYGQMLEIGSEKSKPVNVKAQYAGSGSDPAGLTGTYGGHLIKVDRLNMVPDMAPLRPASIIDYIGRSSTNSDRVEYAYVASKTNNADTVPERNAGNTGFGTKPQSELTFALRDETVRTVAHWIPSSRQVLQDAPRLRDIIDTFLTDGLRVKLENLVINGSGTNEFRGVIAGAGLSRVHAMSGRAFDADDNIVDTIRRGITDIKLLFFTADGILLHPTQAETLELLKDDQGNYMNVFNPLAQTVWRIPVIESQVVSAGTGIVANWSKGCTLWDRMQTDLRIGEPGEFFIQNAVAILAEFRAAFGLIFEDMFEVITNLP